MIKTKKKANKSKQPNERMLVAQAALHPGFIIVLLAIILWATKVMHLHNDMERLGVIVFGAWLWLLAAVDAKTRILPNILTLTGLVLAFMFANYMGHSKIDAAAGAVLGGGLFLLVSVVFKALTGRSGMGGGDIKLMAMLGAWGGVVAIPLILLIASFSALGYLLLKKLAGKDHSVIAFGPWLCLGGWFGALYYADIWAHLFVYKSALLATF